MPPQKKPKKPPKEVAAEQAVPPKDPDEVPDDDLAPDAEDRGDSLPPELERFVTEDADGIEDHTDDVDPRLPKEEVDG